MSRDTKEVVRTAAEWDEDKFETLVMPDEIVGRTLRSSHVSIEESSLVVIGGPHRGLELNLDKDIIHIGRADWCDLVLPEDRWVSGHHCIMRVGPEGVRVRDKGSRNGIFLGGHQIFEANLKPGSQLQVGESLIELRATATTKELSIKFHDQSGQLVGRSERMRQIFSLLPRLANRDISVLLTGETGTGKTSIANLLHQQSLRQNGPFISVNAGALPASLIEASLFGHEKGAFTGADQKRQGYFEQADGGTLFLDEIGELPLELQPKLLDVLERQKVRRIGGSKEIDIDFRLLTATHHNLAKEVSEGRFREDLYYRLSVVELEVPALRSRPEDIPLLADLILSKLSPNDNVRLSPTAMEQLQEYLWPGNVRELRNVLERALAFLDGQVIDQETLGLAPIKEQSLPNRDTPISTSLKPNTPNTALPDPGDSPISLKQLMEDTERDILFQMLQKTDWNVENAAHLLEISKGWFYNRIKKYDLKRPDS